MVGLGPTFAVGNKNYSNTINVEHSIWINMIQLVFFSLFVYIYIYMYIIYTHQQMASQTNATIYIAYM